MPATTLVTEAVRRSWEALRRLEVPAWQADAANPERVRAALEWQVPELASGTRRLQRVEVKGCRLREETGRWSCTFLLTLAREPGTPAEIVPIRGELYPPGMAGPERGPSLAPFGSEGWRVYLPELRLELRTMPPETQLPVLPQLMDPEAARELLERSIRTCTPRYSKLRIEACTPRVARYKPGSRCTLLYRLQYADGVPAESRGPEAVVAKVHRGEDGRCLYAAMHALWESRLGRGDVVAVAEPLAYVPELKLLVQSALPEDQTLKQFLRAALSTDEAEAWERLRHYMHMTALGLAELHACGVGFGDAVAWEDELLEIRDWNARLALSMPQQAEATAGLLARLLEFASCCPADPPGPAHRSFRPVQVLLHGENIGFIDFDGFCQAEPALDVAQLMTEIRHIGLSEFMSAERATSEPSALEARRSRLTRLDGLCDAFVKTYASLRPLSEDRLALWEALFLVTLLQSAWTKLKPERIEEALLLLERHRFMNGAGDRLAGSRP